MVAISGGGASRLGRRLMVSVVGGLTPSGVLLLGTDG